MLSETSCGHTPYSSQGLRVGMYVCRLGRQWVLKHVFTDSPLREAENPNVASLHGQRGLLLNKGHGLLLGVSQLGRKQTVF